GGGGGGGGVGGGDVEGGGHVCPARDGEAAVIRVRAGPELPGTRRNRHRRIVVEPHRTDRPVDLVVEERLVHGERQRGEPHQEADELGHSPAVGGRPSLETGRRGRPEVRVAV